MKFLKVIFLLLICANVAFSQKKGKDSDYIYIPGSGAVVHKSGWTPYLVGVEGKIIDIREATPKQLEIINSRMKLTSLSNERFGNLFVNARQGMFPRKSLIIRFDAQTKAEVYRGNPWMWGTLSQETVIIEGETDVEIADAIITPETAKNYRYRIIQNDNKELQGWKTPAEFRKTLDGKFTYAFLSKIKYQPGQLIQVEIYNINNYKDRCAVILDWRPVRNLEISTMLAYKSRNWPTVQNISLGKDKDAAIKQVNFIETDTLADVKFHLADSVLLMEFISLHLKTPYNYKMTLRKTIDDKVQVIELGEFNGRFQLHKVFWNEPGHYSISFVPVLIKHGGNKKNYIRTKTTEYKFTVLPPLHPKRLFSSREIAIIAVILCGVFGALLAVVVNYLKKKNAGRVLKANQQKELAKTQLSSVRAQLNPHFMYNALAGIQNLMNKNDTDTANRYLGKFARITRNVLKNNELISLRDEQALLDDYLQMEQLRFRFKYSIETDGLDIDNIEIPSMLLQPFVENAVKYGRSENEPSEISIVFSHQKQDLILTVTDNGPGFNSAKKHDGFGLSLTQNRAVLLNEIYKENKIAIDIASSGTGTTIAIVLKHWL